MNLIITLKVVMFIRSFLPFFGGVFPTVMFYRNKIDDLEPVNSSVIFCKACEIH